MALKRGIEQMLETMGLTRWTGGGGMPIRPAILSACPSAEVRCARNSHVTHVAVPHLHRSHAANPGLIRQLAIVLSCPLLEDMDHASLLESLCSLLVGLSSYMQQVGGARLLEVAVLPPGGLTSSRWPAIGQRALGPAHV